MGKVKFKLNRRNTYLPTHHFSEECEFGLAGYCEQIYFITCYISILKNFGGQADYVLINKQTYSNYNIYLVYA